MKQQMWKTLALWTVILLVLFAMYQYRKTATEKPKTIDYSEFFKAVQDGEVSEVTFMGSKISGTYTDRSKFTSYGPTDLEVFEKLSSDKVKVTYAPDDEISIWQHILTWVPIVLIIAVMAYFWRQMQNTGGRALSFGKARVRLLKEGQQKVTFADVAGIDEAKQELVEIIEFLRDPKKFTKLGGRIPKGVLLVGLPGTGKTLLARAIAGEAGVPFFSISGSDFVEMFVGVGASRVRDLFVQGKKNAPCIIFIDEIDAVGRHRGAGLGGGHDEREQTLNQLLVEMDGFESNEGVILIAATNRPDVLDPALLRPGRFDRQVVVPRPDVRGRIGILKVHSKKVPLAEGVNLETIARGTPGFSGADLENLVNEAALLAARKGQEKVEASDFEFAKDKVLMGIERRSLIISVEERNVTAYHESGHAMVARLIPGTDPVHKVTIIPRGRALGVTQQLPQEDKYFITRTYAYNDLAILMGGRAAEELVLGDQTSGAGNDIEHATELARRMVCEWGMSEKLGPLTFGKKEEQVFLGRDFATHKDYSESTAVEIDQEIKRLVQENYVRARTLIQENLPTLHRLAKALLEHEVLEGEQIERIMHGEELGPLRDLSAPGPSAATAIGTSGRTGTQEEKGVPSLVPTPDAMPGKA